MIVVAVLSLPFLFVLAGKPILRRLALRNATLIEVVQRDGGTDSTK